MQNTASSRRIRLADGVCPSVGVRAPQSASDETSHSWAVETARSQIRKSHRRLRTPGQGIGPPGVLVQIVKPERRFSGLDSFGPRRRGFVVRVLGGREASENALASANTR